MGINLYTNLLLNMIYDQCISVTELKKDTKKVFETLKKEWEMVVLINNKPVAILKDVKNSSLNTKEYFSFDFWEEGIDADVILDYFKNKK